MAENEASKDQAVDILEKTLKKYKIFFFSSVSLLVIAILLFTNYDFGNKLTGYIGPTADQKGAQTATQPDESVPELTPKIKVVPPQADESVPELTKKTTTVKPISDIKLTKVSLSSKEFNPLVNDVTFTIKTSADAKLDIKIYDKDGNLAASPIDNKDVTGDKEYEIHWEGNNDSKKVLPVGAYSYKVIAKDLDTKEAKDTKTGDISLKYGTAVKDFEDINGKTSGSNSAKPSQTIQAIVKAPQSNSAATVALQNSKEGKTAGTGPETIIYLIFPILGYTVGRKFK